MAVRPGDKGGSTSRPFSSAGSAAFLRVVARPWVAGVTAILFVARYGAALLLAAGIAASAAGTPLVVTGTAGATRLLLIDCRSGDTLAIAAPAAALATAPVVSRDGRSLHVATRAGDLLRYSLPELRVEARTALDYEVTALAVGDGADGVVLAGGRGRDALSAHDPETLTEVHRYREPRPLAVAALLDRSTRQRFVVGFADLREVWEIAYGRDAPPVLQGLVHDYRSNEAIPLPGRFTPRRFEVPTATRALVPGPAPYEIARIDDAGTLGIVHLDVRREIERPALATPPQADRVVAWGKGAQRGLLVAASGADVADVLVAPSWKASDPFDVGAAILALAPTRGGVLLANAAADGLTIRLADVAGRSVETLATGIAPGALPLRFVAGTEGCVALVDHDGRWLAGVVVPPLK